MRLTPGIEADFYSLGIIMYEMMIGKVTLNNIFLYKFYIQNRKRQDLNK